MLPPVLQVMVMVIALVAGVYDILYRRIPNWLVLPGFLLGLALNAFLYPWAGLGSAAAGAGLALLIYFPLYLLRGMGAGDVKLMAALGAIVGWRSWIAIFILTGILGGVFALVLMAVKGRFRRTLSNLGYMLWEMAHLRPPHLRSEELDVASPKALTLPHGVVIALAAMAFLGGGWWLRS